MAGTNAHIIQALIANGCIATGKGFAAVYSGSGAMLAETIHSAADCVNQLLLLFGVWRAKKPATPTHPLGYGRAMYFWSFMVALLIFAGGGVFSLYEGIHKISHPEPLTSFGLSIGVLLFALVIEGAATWSNVKEMKKRRGEVPFLKYLRETKDSDLIVVFGENSAATLGLFFALVAISLAAITGNPQWDGFGSAVIGVVLIGVAFFLALEVKSLLVGESADPRVEAALREMVAAQQGISKLFHVITIQQGPGQVMLLIKVGYEPELTTHQLCDAINSLEDKVRAKFPEVRWCFIEPDRPRA